MLFLAGILTAQDQLENSGFEEWEDISASETDTIREPVDWSSLKTSDVPSLNALAPVVCARSSIAHSGAYSVELTNVLSFIVANGVVTSGRVHPDLNTDLAYMFTDTQDDQWNMPFNARPDSIAGWFNYVPQGEDFLEVSVILHRGFGKQPDPDSLINWIGMAEYSSPQNTGGEWYRFSAPFQYFSDSDPEYALVILNSGNGYSPVAGSVALFDDFEMIYNQSNSLKDMPDLQDGSVYVVNNRLLVIRGLNQNGFKTIRIHDLTGRLVWASTVDSDRIDISSVNLRKGIYLVTVTGKSLAYSQKIILR